MGSASSTVSETAPDAASRLEGLAQREAEERLRQVGPNELCEKGFRVLAVASRRVDRRLGFSAAD